MQQTNRVRLRTLSAASLPTASSAEVLCFPHGQRARLRIIVDKCWLFRTAVILQQMYVILCPVVQWVVHGEWEGRQSANTNDVRLQTFTCVCQVVNVKILLQPLLQKDKGSTMQLFHSIWVDRAPSAFIVNLGDRRPFNWRLAAFRMQLHAVLEPIFLNLYVADLIESRGLLWHQCAGDNQICTASDITWVSSKVSYYLNDIVSWFYAIDCSWFHGRQDRDCVTCDRRQRQLTLADFLHHFGQWNRTD